MISGLPEEELFANGHTACAGCGQALAVRYVLKAVGKNCIVANATGCLEVFTTHYPQTSWRVPWIHAAFATPASLASGICAALKKLGKDIPVLSFGGDGSTYDIGLSALSGAVERGHNFTHVCFENGAYMNTGVQRSGDTPKFADTTTAPYGKKIHGKQQLRKRMPFIMAAHGCYVATANIAYPIDLVNKIRKAVSIKGPAYVEIFSPCVPGWRYDPSLTIELGRLAVKSLSYPLYEIENGLVKISEKVSQPIPVRDYLKPQGRFKKLTENEINDIQNSANDFYKVLSDLEEKQVRLY